MSWSRILEDVTWSQKLLQLHAETFHSKSQTGVFAGPVHSSEVGFWWQLSLPVVAKFPACGRYLCVCK